MRPLELELRNFRSYQGGGARFDFRDRRLVGIVGPIGSGKSSLLDAISFALYGKTPTSGSNRKTLINQRSSDMAVKLRFAVGDEIWEVVRQLRRKGSAQHALYRLDSDGVTTGLDAEDAESRAEIVEKITMDGPVNSRIEELLGLDYDAFGRSVMLAQNRFSEFLSAGAAQRDVVLKGVFGHDRIDHMRTRAKELLADADAVLEKLVVRTEQLEAVGVRLAATTVKRAAAAKRLGRLHEALPRAEKLDEQLGAARKAIDDATKQLAALLGSGAELPPEGQTADLLGAARGAAARRLELAAALDARAEELAAAESDSVALMESGEDALIDKAATLITQRAMQQDELQQTRATIEELESSLTSMVARTEELETAAVAAAERSSTATDAVSQADAAAVEAQALVTAAEHNDMAATLRATLVGGHDCPVCEQTVATVPATRPVAALDELRSRLNHTIEHRTTAERERAAAVAEVSRLDEALEAHRRTVEETRRRYESAVKQLDVRREDMERVGAELDDLVGPGDHDALLDARRERKVSLSATVQRRKLEFDRVRQAHEQAVRDTQSVDREMSSLVATLAAVGGRLGVTLSPDRDQPDEVEQAVATLRETWTATVGGLKDRVASGEAELLEASDGLAALREELDVDRPLAEAIASLESTVDHLEAEIERDQAEMDAAEALLEEKRATERRIDVFTQLVRDLRDSEFVRFLLDEERARLAALGSDHFLRLSSGRYAFTEDGDFSIVDLTSADAVRRAASLSGGETFLASLALALALAEMVSRSGGRLDAFFLDEGFGSLDAEHLDLAMEGIEALVTDDLDRLVVVVSHVPELRHRIDDRIQLDRDPLTGNTRIIQA